MLSCIINGPFFGIPNTYLEHTQSASEFRGRLADIKVSWETYSKQLTDEYSDFVLAVRLFLFLLVVNSSHIATQSLQSYYRTYHQPST